MITNLHVPPRSQWTQTRSGGGIARDERSMLSCNNRSSQHMQRCPAPKQYKNVHSGEGVAAGGLKAAQLNAGAGHTWLQQHDGTVHKNGHGSTKPAAVCMGTCGTPQERPPWKCCTPSTCRKHMVRAPSHSTEPPGGVEHETAGADIDRRSIMCRVIFYIALLQPCCRALAGTTILSLLWKCNYAP